MNYIFSIIHFKNHSILQTLGKWFPTYQNISKLIHKKLYCYFGASSNYIGTLMAYYN